MFTILMKSVSKRGGGQSVEWTRMVKRYLFQEKGLIFTFSLQIQPSAIGVTFRLVHEILYKRYFGNKKFMTPITDTPYPLNRLKLYELKSVFLKKINTLSDVVILWLPTFWSSKILWPPGPQFFFPKIYAPPHTTPNDTFCHNWHIDYFVIKCQITVLGSHWLIHKTHFLNWYF